MPENLSINTDTNMGIIEVSEVINVDGVNRKEDNSYESKQCFNCGSGFDWPSDDRRR